MSEDVYVGIDVSKTELVVAVRPGSESFRSSGGTLITSTSIITHEKRST
jgi:hypothetical protein